MLRTKFTFHLILFILLSGITLLFSCQKKLSKITTKAVFVANEESGTISVIDAESQEKIKDIDLNEMSFNGKKIEMLMPHNVQVSPDNKTVWVTGISDLHTIEDQIIVIDAIKLKVIKRINVGYHQHLAHVILDTESKYAFASATETNEIIKINAETYKVEARIKLGNLREPHGMRYSNGNLYVANLGYKSLGIVNVNSGNTQDIMLGGMPVQTAVSSDGKYAYASLFDLKSIAIIDLNSMDVTKVALPADSQGPIQIYLTPDNQQLFICDQGDLMGRPVSNKVYVLNTSTKTVSEPILVGNKAHGVAINTQGTFAYVTNTDDNSVSIIDISKNKVIKTVLAGKEPNGVSCWNKK